MPCGVLCGVLEINDMPFFLDLAGSHGFLPDDADDRIGPGGSARKLRLTDFALVQCKYICVQ